VRKTRRQTWLLLLGLLALGLIANFLWRGSSFRSSHAPEQKVLFYQDSMHPWVKSGQPGKCTICSMDLTPIYEGQTGFGLSNNLVVLSSNSITVLNVQASDVKRQPLRSTLRVAGTLEANETRKTIVSAPAPCQIEAMAVEYAGVEVEKGQPLISLFSPELVQKAGYFRGTTANPRYSPVGLAPPKDSSNPYSRELSAPQSGVVVERNAYVGQYVAEGEKLLTIVDASVLWFRFDVYERQLSWLETGQKIDVVVPAVPGKVFPAVIAFLEPTLNEVTRTVKVRADVNNPVAAGKSGAHRLLRFGMYAEGRVRADVPDVLAVPRTAILFPGGAAYAYVDRRNGAYERRQVKLGRQGDELWEILGGLDEGDRVVTAGNVLMDAQAQFNQGGELDDVAVTGTTSLEPAAPSGPGTGAMDHASTASGTAMPAPDEEPRAAAQAGVAEPLAGVASTPSVLPDMGTNVMSSAAVPGIPRGEGAQTPTNRPLTRAALSSARMAYKEEMWRNRMALIAAAHERGDTNATSPAADRLAAAPVMAPSETPPPAMAAPTEATPEMGANAAPSAPAEPVTGPNRSQSSSNAVRSYREADAAPRALSAEMRQLRMAAIAEASAKQATNVTSLSMNQRQALAAFVAEAGGISRALAADELDKFNQQVVRLAAVLQPLQKELAAPHRWQGLVERLAGSSGNAAPAKDLAEARKWFLPFSTAMVELAKQLRKEDSAFTSLKIYHCPMAPKPGLWIQSKPPLANPFYGAKMLTCGEEVRE